MTIGFLTKGDWSQLIAIMSVPAVLIGSLFLFFVAMVPVIIVGGGSSPSQDSKRNRGAYASVSSALDAYFDLFGCTGGMRINTTGGKRMDMMVEFPKPTHGPGPQNGQPPFRTLGDAINLPH
jgi:hypothetical protein